MKFTRVVYSKYYRINQYLHLHPNAKSPTHLAHLHNFLWTSPQEWIPSFFPNHVYWWSWQNSGLHITVTENNYRCADSNYHLHAESIMPTSCSTASIVVPINFVSEGALDSPRSHPQPLYHLMSLWMHPGRGEYRHHRRIFLKLNPGNRHCGQMHRPMRQRLVESALSKPMWNQ